MSRMTPVLWSNHKTELPGAEWIAGEGQSHERAVLAALARLRRPYRAAGPILVRFPSVETLG
jgi:hypothetical protein